MKRTDRELLCLLRLRGGETPERERKQILNLLKRLLSSLQRIRSGATLPDYEAAMGPWVREFPGSDPWLIEFLLVIPMLTGRINRETDRLLYDLNVPRVPRYDCNFIGGA